jgi:drug/metabolite transporter (DMT)-like permease
VAIFLSLLAALAFGSSDFAAGLGGRRIGAGKVALIVQILSLVAALVAIPVYSGQGPGVYVLGWGLLAGVGSALGTLALYRGFVIGQMSVVAPLSAVMAAAVPVLVGLVLGEQLSILAGIGLLIAFPAIALVSWRRDETAAAGARRGVLEGIASGVGFALIYIGLDQAGTESGAWPVVSEMVLSSLIVLPFAWLERDLQRASAASVLLTGVAGLLGGAANILFLAAAGLGRLSIVAVLTSLYPGVTVILARVILREYWTRTQAAGLGASVVAVALITLG